MREYISLFTLILIFFSIAFLSGYRTENSSACSTPPEIIVGEPKDSEDIENQSIKVSFDAIQNTSDSVTIDLNRISVIINDNIGKVIDITQYITNNCDILKKNCKFSGSVNLSEGEYILQVQVCNTASACETKEVRFKIIFSKEEPFEPWMCKTPHIAYFQKYYFNSLESMEHNPYTGIPHYNDNISYKLRIGINPNIETFRFKFNPIFIGDDPSTRLKERTDDKLTINYVDQTFWYDGERYSAYFEPLYNSAYIYFFTGDYYELESTSRYFKIVSFEYACGERRRSQESIPLINYPGVRYDGILLGEGDVYFYKVLHFQGSITEIVLSGYNNGDFALYARRDKLPAKNRYDFMGDYANSSDESITIPDTYSTGTYYIAVYSRKGSGQYTIWAANLRRENKKSLNVGTDITFDSKSGFENSIVGPVKKALHIMYKATHGQVYVSNVDIYNSNAFGGSCDCLKRNCYCGPNGWPCDLCITRKDIRAYTINWIYTVVPENCGADTLAHELGHLILKLQDEYRDVDNSSEQYCGHTIMGNFNITSLCNPYNHCKDGILVPCPRDLYDAWTQLSNKFYVSEVPYDTSDMFPLYYEYNAVYDNWMHDFHDELIRISTYYNYSSGCSSNRLE
jgi:hypothetical protein